MPIHIFQSEIFDTVSKIDDSPCYLCARMRRGRGGSERRGSALQAGGGEGFGMQMCFRTVDRFS